MKPNWIFEVISPMGGAMGTAYTNALPGTVSQLAREAIQKSDTSGKAGGL